MENKRRHGRSEFCGNMSNWGRLECKMYRVWCGKINRKFGLDPKDKQFSSSSYHKVGSIFSYREAPDHYHHSGIIAKEQTYYYFKASNHCGFLLWLCQTSVQYHGAR
jgi:hypothetical protein